MNRRRIRRGENERGPVGPAGLLAGRPGRPERSRRPVRRALVSGWLLAAASLGFVLSAERAGGAEAAQALDLPSAARMARRNNPVVLESRANRAAADQAKKEAWLNRLPAIELKETAVRTTSPADVFGLQLMQERFSFPAFMATDPNKPDPFSNFTTQLEATLPLFTGGQLSGGIRQASKMAQAAAAAERQTAFAVDMGVAEAYLGALVAQRFEALAQRARDTTARHVGRARDFYESGMIVESDLLQAEVQLARMEESLIRAEGGADLAAAGLNRALGTSQDLAYELEEPPAPPDSVPEALDSLVTRALRERADLHAVRRKVEAAHAGVGRAQGEYWPQLGVMARYAWNDDRLFGGHGDSYTVGASAQWKLWNWGQTHARVSRSRAELRAARESQRSYEQQVEFEVRSAWQAAEEARARHRVSVGAVRAAERALSILEDRFDQGIAPVTDLLDAETMADEAAVREAQARYDLQVATRRLRYLTGLPPIPEAGLEAGQ